MDGNLTVIEKITNTQTGFSLVELLVSLALALVIIAAFSSAFVSQRRTYAVQEQVAGMIQTARSAMDMIGREAKMAGYSPKGYDRGFESDPTTGQTAPNMQRTDPTASRFVGIPYDSTKLKIVADLNGDGETNGTASNDDENEEITYSYNATTHQIERLDPYVGADPQPFADQIQSFQFKFFDKDGSEVTSSTQQKDIRQIQIKIVSRTADPDPKYTDPTYGDGYRRYELTSFITPPNLDL